jgi:hypothetical protein
MSPVDTARKVAEWILMMHTKNWWFAITKLMKDCEFFYPLCRAGDRCGVCVQGKLECPILIQLEFIYFSWK